MTDRSTFRRAPARTPVALSSLGDDGLAFHRGILRSASDGGLAVEVPGSGASEFRRGQRVIVAREGADAVPAVLGRLVDITTEPCTTIHLALAVPHQQGLAHLAPLPPFADVIRASGFR